MMCHTPRIGQWVMYGPEFKIGKVTHTERKYRTRSGRAWGPVTSVFVLGSTRWWPREQVKVVGSKGRLKTYTNQERPAR